MRLSRLLLWLGALLLVFGACDVGYQRHCQLATEHKALALQTRQRQERNAEIEQAKLKALDEAIAQESAARGPGSITMDYQINGAGSAQANVALAWNNDSGNYSKAWINGDISMFVEPMDDWVIYDGATLLYRNSTSVASADPPENGWDVVGGDAPAPTVTEAAAGDETAPVVASAAIDEDTLTVNFTEADSEPILPAIDIAGFSITRNGSPLAIGNGTRVSPLQATFPVTGGTVYSPATDTILLSYDDVAGNVTDSADPANALASFSNQPVTNNSTEEAPEVSIMKTFTIDTTVNKLLPLPTNPDDDVAISYDQPGSDGDIRRGDPKPMLPQHFSVKRAGTLVGLAAAAVMASLHQVALSISNIVEPDQVIEEDELGYHDYVGGDLQVALALAVVDDEEDENSECADLRTKSETDPATAEWFRVQGNHPDGDHKFSYEGKFAVGEPFTPSAGGRVYQYEFPMELELNNELADPDGHPALMKFVSDIAVEA